MGSEFLTSLESWASLPEQERSCCTRLGETAAGSPVQDLVLPAGGGGCVGASWVAKGVKALWEVPGDVDVISLELYSA